MQRKEKSTLQSIITGAYEPIGQGYTWAILLCGVELKSATLTGDCPVTLLHRSVQPIWQLEKPRLHPFAFI